MSATLHVWRVILHFSSLTFCLFVCLLYPDFDLCKGVIIKTLLTLCQGVTVTTDLVKVFCSVVDWTLCSVDPGRDCCSQMYWSLLVMVILRHHYCHGKISFCVSSQVWKVPVCWELSCTGLCNPSFYCFPVLPN